MQLHFSPSMRSVTISSSNGFIDLMKIKIAARHISYRTLFHTILILAFLLPFVFILTAVVTLEGVNNCSSFGTHVLLFIIIIMLMFVFLLICVLLIIIHIYKYAFVYPFVWDMLMIFWQFPCIDRSVEFSISTSASLLYAAVRELQCRWSCLLLVTVNS